MKTDITFAEIRAGLISSFILAIAYLYVTGLSNQFRVWAFMVLFAVCFVLMMKSVTDLLVWSFVVAATFFGRGLGKTARLIRNFYA